MIVRQTMEKYWINKNLPITAKMPMDRDIFLAYMKLAHI